MILALVAILGALYGCIAAFAILAWQAGKRLGCALFGLFAAVLLFALVLLGRLGACS